MTVVYLVSHIIDFELTSELKLFDLALTRNKGLAK